MIHIDESTPHLFEFRALLETRYRLFKGVVDRVAATFGPAWIQEFDETLGRLFPSADSLSAAVRGYALFVMDLLRRQKRFENDGEYPAKSYEEAAAEVYLDPEYMRSEYLPGLVLSHFLWPHHVRQMSFYETAFVSQMKLRGATSFVEIGVGTGLYSRRTLEQLPEARAVGFDISPASAEFAREHMRAFGIDDRFDVRLRDVVAEPLSPCEWLVCVEVLEHLEDPVEFLRALRAALAPGGRAFITAALNAPHVDHIYLYRTSEDVIDQLDAAGFVLEQSFMGLAHKPTAPGLPVPAVVAYVVE